jgi:hypothetical protein
MTTGHFCEVMAIINTDNQNFMFSSDVKLIYVMECASMEVDAKLTLKPKQQCVIARFSLKERDASYGRTIAHH